MDKQKEKRGGVFRMSQPFLKQLTDFFTGKAKLVNKNLEIRTLRRIDSDRPLFDAYYEIGFRGDDLPLVGEGCYPSEVTIEKVEDKKNCFKLVNF